VVSSKICDCAKKIIKRGHSYSEFPFVFLILPFSKIVDKIDADEDGFVTEAELKAWIKKAQKKYIYDNVDRQWKDFDMNNDGMISWDEYKNITYGTYLGKNAVSFYCNSKLD